MTPILTITMQGEKGQWQTVADSVQFYDGFIVCFDREGNEGRRLEMVDIVGIVARVEE